MPAISSALTLDGTPKDPGTYLISIDITDDQGRTATSNALPFRIYAGDEKLADRLVLENLTQTQDGKYMWNIMEPWSISAFGSNVAGEDESVRVPAEVKAWYGSNTSGTYGFLGYDIPWADVQKGNIPQTLYIPAGCDLTFVNMEILSSVKIVVENGGKLNLMDSTVQGIIEVKNGGTFSMNYDSFNKDFVTGASICGQLRLEDGATLENAAIYSHSNYLANGDLVDRNISDPVVSATGNIAVKGIVAIKGEDDGPGIGQMGLRIKDGTLTLEEGATLVAIGGEGNINNNDGGTALDLDNATITGKGKLVGIGGSVLFGNGGTAITGNGTISTKEIFLRGATASGNSNPGKAADSNVRILSPNQSVENGQQKELGSNDPLADLYWKTGSSPLPPLAKYTTSPVPTFTVTYTDGVDGEEIFADQVYSDLVTGADTPAYNGTPAREGYTFKGWDPQVAATVSANATYTAQWEKNTNPENPSNPSNPSNPANPSNPTNPSNPSNPSNPGNPSNPSNPTTPSETTDNGGHHHSGSSDNTAAEQTTTTSSTAVKTGDESPVLLLTLLLLAAAVLTGMVAYRIRRRNYK